jgi:predicted HNH restriction endonuclease
MSSHFEGHTVGKDRCDAFLASLQEIDPGVERDIGRNSCSFRIGGQAALCHVYHLKTRSDLTVWVRSASISDEGAHGFEIRRRESTGTGWAERFPAKFKLTEDASINDAAVLALECLTPPVQPRISAFRLAEEAEVTRAVFEGALTRVEVNRYERDRGARGRCIAHHGHICAVCSFDFGATYGSYMEGYIHVHHIKPLSEVSGRTEVDAKTDLVPVCPNCHAALHGQVPPLSIEALRAILRASAAEAQHKPL